MKNGEPFRNPELRITSYNVCYTKLLRLSVPRYAEFLAGGEEVGPHGRPVTREGFPFGRKIVGADGFRAFPGYVVARGIDPGAAALGEGVGPSRHARVFRVKRVGVYPAPFRGRDHALSVLYRVIDVLNAPVRQDLRLFRAHPVQEFKRPLRVGASRGNGDAPASYNFV